MVADLLKSMRSMVVFFYVIAVRAHKYFAFLREYAQDVVAELTLLFNDLVLS